MSWAEAVLWLTSSWWHVTWVIVIGLAIVNDEHLFRTAVLALLLLAVLR